MRTLSDGATEFFALDQIRPVTLGVFEFASGPVRLWTGNVEMQWAGVTWYPCGGLARIGEIEESSDGRALGMEVELGAIPCVSVVDGVEIDITAIALNEDWQQRPARLHQGYLNEDLTWRYPPFQVRKGMMDVMELSEDGKNARIRLTIESHHFDNERAEIHRQTAESQRARHPGDAFYDQVASLQDKPVTWNLG